MTQARKDRRSMPLYMRILVAVAREPKRASDIGKELRTGEVSIHRAMRVMRGRLAHVADYTKQKHGRPTARWLLGAQPDAPAPDVVTQFERRRHIGPSYIGAEMAGFLALMEAMMSEPRSMKELLALSGCVRNTILKVITIGRRGGVIHIAEYERERSAGAYAPCYAFGVDRPDAARPKSQPRHVVERRYRQARYAKDQQYAIAHALAANSNAFAEAA